ncbi:MAG: TraR/DksA family transcriptional regulator [Acidimicrobiales bacterium]
MTATFQGGSRSQAAHLDPEAIARLRAVMVAVRAERAALVAAHAATVAELTGHGDVDSILERELAGSSAAGAREAIDDIDAALARMDAGAYGLCESCGVPGPS